MGVLSFMPLHVQRASGGVSHLQEALPRRDPERILDRRGGDDDARRLASRGEAAGVREPRHPVPPRLTAAEPQPPDSDRAGQFEGITHG